MRTWAPGPVRSLAIIAVIAAFGAFCLWWGGSGAPLSATEKASLIAALQRQLPQDATSGDTATFHRIRALMDRDNGGELYMVNIEKTRDRPAKPPGFSPPKDIAEAERRYAGAILPMQLKAGGVPVLVAGFQGDFLGAEPGFDRIAIVRWRSLRDFLRFGTSAEYQKVAPLKWSAVESTRLVVVRPALSLFMVRTLFGALGLLIIAALLLVGTRRRDAFGGA
ncbi:MAG: DUF1330 domain-containing protein [Caulobacterales bacterium]|nr:DUF1330 domain-containing protein [Caulobacterales bacterium]